MACGGLWQPERVVELRIGCWPKMFVDSLYDGWKFLPLDERLGAYVRRRTDCQSDQAVGFGGKHVGQTGVVDPGPRTPCCSYGSLRRCSLFVATVWRGPMTVPAPFLPASYRSRSSPAGFTRAGECAVIGVLRPDGRPAAGESRRIPRSAFSQSSSATCHLSHQPIPFSNWR